ncbi:MAG: RluA family pseudouridine synthase [Elusimicrobiota bacterium]
MKEYIEVPFRVSERPETAGGRLDAFLAERLQTHSRSLVQKFIREGRVFLRGRRAKASTRVGVRDTVFIRYPPRREGPSPHAGLPVLFEDEHLLAVNKPGDVLSHPAGKIVRNAATTILAAQFPGERLHLVHRLDRETSGILLFAKNPGAAFRLARQFEERTVSKEYLAVVHGVVGFGERTVDEPIGPEGGRIRVRQAVDRGRGQPATTHFRRLAAGGRYSLVRAAPRSGRLHQIRVHLAWLGHPVLGDKLYFGGGAYFLKMTERELGAEDFGILGAKRQLLHAGRLSIRHPGNAKLLMLEAPPPEDFQRVIIKEELTDNPVH